MKIPILSNHDHTKPLVGCVDIQDERVPTNEWGCLRLYPAFVRDEAGRFSLVSFGLCEGAFEQQPAVPKI